MTVTHSDSLGRPGNSSMIAAWCTRCKVLKDTESDNEIWKWTRFEVWNLLIYVDMTVIQPSSLFTTSGGSFLTELYLKWTLNLWKLIIQAPEDQNMLRPCGFQWCCAKHLGRLDRIGPGPGSRPEKLQHTFLRMIQDDPSESISPGSLIATLHPIASSLGPKWARSGYRSGCNMM